MTQMILVLIIPTIGYLLYTGPRPGKHTLAVAGDLLGPKIHGALLILIMILVFIGR